MSIGASKPGFKPPPPSLKIPEVLDFHAEQNADYPFFRYAQDDVVHQISYAQLKLGIERAAAYALEVGRGSDAPVAVLAITDSITYLTTMFGLFRAGIKAFCISTRNSVTAISHLLEQTGSQCLLVSSDDAMQQLAEQAVKHQAGSIPIKPMATYEQLYQSKQVEVPLLGCYDLDSIALILHTSGSTNFPKPVYLTHRNLLEWGREPLAERNFTGEVIGSHSLPPFHSMGVMTPLWCATVGMENAVFPPVSPPIWPTPENVYKGTVASGTTYVYCVPSHIERWAAMPEAHENLAKLKAIVYAGAPLSPEVGDLLAAKGVNLRVYFGSTETGGMCLFLPHRESRYRNREWGLFRVGLHCNYHIVKRKGDPLEEENDVSELHFLAGPKQSLSPGIFNTTFEGHPAYTTGDLVVPVMVDGQQWFRFYGRKDDQILLSTGEKTNPVPIEKILLEDANIDHVILFGQGKQQNGALVQPSAAYLEDEATAGPLSNDDRLIRFRQRIAPTLAAANKFAPAHSFIFPELVIIADHPFQLTPKGTVRRRFTLNEFNGQIENAYLEVERSTLPDLRGPAAGDWTINNTFDFVSAVVTKVTEREIPPNEDFFEQGADSLQATWIRNTVLRVLREAGFNTRQIPSDLVFQFPTVQRLAAFLYGYSFTAGAASASEDQEEASEQETIVWPETGKVGETILKLRPAKEGEVPLIVLHGGSGSIHAFPPLQEKFRSAVWAIQVTPDTPMDSLDSMLEFYYRAIKREQPQGPYRLAGYSATAVLGVALARKLEDDGSAVLQVALLDGVPNFFAHPVFGIDDKSLLTDAARLDQFNRACCEVICDLLRRDAGGRVGQRHKLAAELIAALNGEEGVPESTMIYLADVLKILTIMVKFMLRNDFPGTTVSAEDTSALASLTAWEKGLKAPVSVYIASDGMMTTIPEADRAEWAALGATKLWPNAKVHFIPGGHYDFIGHDKLVDLLQSEWI